jgi:exopolyphosphatase/guanosine-5'-triphosphate,3'-diphosphate pyrophosphatase
METSVPQQKKIGLDYWMQQVLELVDKVADGFGVDAVHDLRTALRRCRSMADGLMVFDSDRGWKKMREAGKQLFQSLGALRDTHVLKDWIEKLAPEGDESSRTLEQFLDRREQEQRITAATSLQQFDREKWNIWTHQLPSRAARILRGSPLFAHLALERWQEAHVLHHRALRNRTNVAYHDLRIGVKHFRYTVENFLPGLHEFWADDLKEVQDALGDVHDIDVLWATALRVNAFPGPAIREAWRARVLEQRQLCLEKYRRKMVGEDSLWAVWRAALPKAVELRALGSRRLEIWASFLDPSVGHSRHVAHLAEQLFDGLSGEAQRDEREQYRHILRAAAIMHDVGRSKMHKGHHKESARLIRKLRPPLGWTAEQINLASLIARYHRGAMPSQSQKRFSALPESKRPMVQLLGGILRFACACDREHNAQIRRVEVESSNPILRVRADGYGSDTSLAEHLAAARYLLELAYHRPVFVVSAESHAA